MSKKDVCINNKSVAYYSGFGGLEVKHIEYGINDYIYCVSGAWNGKPKYHKLKIYDSVNGDCYIKFNGCKCALNEFIRM